MVSARRLLSPVAVGVAALLTVTWALIAGFAPRGDTATGSRIHAHTPCPAPLAGHTPGTGDCQPPRRELPAHAKSATRAPLRALAEQHGIRLGSAVHSWALDDEEYSTLLGDEFNAVTVENEMKWSRIEPERGEHDRERADQIIAFAREHDQQVYGHTLVWHKRVPEWVTGGSFTDAELRAALRNHVVDEAGYFRGRVWAWDVVNEALSRDGSLRNSFWLERLGPDFIADAFRWARTADPDAMLFINDYGIEGINAKSNGLYQLVQDLLADGVPIDGVGFQTHWTLDPLPETFTDNLRRFAALGLDVAITEMDVRIPQPATPESMVQQAEIYAQALSGCLAVSRCTSFTVWGFTDAHSWVPHAYPGSGGAALFDEDLRPKPAYTAMADAMGGAGEDVE